MKATRSLWVAAALALSFCQIAAHAQDAAYPNRPIKMLVGFGAGGGTDIAARIMAQKMSEILGQSIVVENRTGASGMIAAEDEAKSAPDGYTLMMGSQTTYAVAPNLYRKVTLDAAKDFAGVAMTGASPLVLVVNPSFAAQSVKDVIAMAKANPGKINFGTGGLGTTPHMTAELFQYTAGIKMVHVAYRGEAPAINDLLAGQIPLMFANLSAVMGNLKGGTLRALAVTGAQRWFSLPEVPTMIELGYPNFVSDTFNALFAPAGTPPAIVALLVKESRAAFQNPEARDQARKVGFEIVAGTPEQLAARVAAEVPAVRDLVTKAGIKAE